MKSLSQSKKPIAVLRPVSLQPVALKIVGKRVAPLPELPFKTKDSQPLQTSVKIHPTYLQMSDLPPHTEVSSEKNNRYAVNRKTQESLFVLKLKGCDDTYSVIATKEVFGSAIYQGMVSRITDDGFKLRSCGIVDGPLIACVYKDNNDSSQLDEQDIKPIIREIDGLAIAALERNASDIHIEKRAGSANVKMRVNGRLEGYSDSWVPAYVLQMARALHTIADEDSKDTVFSPEGQLSVSRTLQPNGQRVKLRVQMSTAYPDEGLDIVIRVLKVAASANVMPLDKLGYSPEHLEMIEYMLSSPGGLTIVSGTTGSGKSTTLQTAMMNIRQSDMGLKLISIEDPPEYVLEGVTQIPVPRRRNAKADENPFTNSMRNTMRMDPDVIMIGEVRDQETATLMVSMVQSGHKVLSTIHTESALGVIGRLRSMGIDSDVLGARRFISGLIFQTLVPVLCNSCKVDYDPTLSHMSAGLHERIKHVKKPEDTIFVEALNTPEHPNTCKHCRGKGIVGRTVCAEMVIPDAKILECIRNNDMTAAHTHWRSLRVGKAPTSMIGGTALEHALLKMRRGDVSPQNVESALGPLYDFSLEGGAVGAEINNLLGLE